MKTNTRMRLVLSLTVFMTVLMITGCNKESFVEPDVSTTTTDAALKNNPSTQNRLLAEIRRSTAKYHDLDAAAADGYQLDPHCVEHPLFGGMGQHAVNMGRIIPFVVPSEPGVLVYEFTEDGEYKLVAAEYLIPSVPWDAMNDGPPMLGTVAFDDHREIIFAERLDAYGNVVLDEEGNPVLEPRNAKGGPPFPHYQLHVWVWKNNPRGMYFPFNPKVSCQYAH